MTKNLEEMKRSYMLPNGDLNIAKALYDLSFWLDFSEEYHIDKIGGLIVLREYLGDPKEFIKKFNKE